jgi:hypothetical protein
MLVFSCKVRKKNEFKLNQTRNLVLTSSALYNFKNKRKAPLTAELKRRIPLELLEAVTVSLKTDEFVLHVKGERDYLLRSSQ